MQTFKLFRFHGRKAYEGEERRRKPRIYYPIPIIVRTAGCSGKRFEFDTYAHNIGAGGFSAPAAKELRPGQKLFFIVKFSLNKIGNLRTTAIAAYGFVLRCEKQNDGSYVFASTFDRHRFI
jgi:hypothetical protein